MDDNILGNRIKQLRREHGLTQEEFGKKYNIKKSTVSQYESGISRPDDELKKRIASDFNVSIDWLLGLSEYKTPVDRISQAIGSDEELLAFWEETKDRENVQLLFKQIRVMSDKDINQVLRIIKAIEDEEEKEGN